jgi:tetratricopeptide (TPR) repeat protein
MAQGQEVTVRSMLRDTASRLDEGEFAGLPEAEASVRTTLGKTYLSLGLYNDAEKQLRAAGTIQARELGEEHPDTLRTRSILGRVLWRQHKNDEAEELLRATVDSQRRLLGEDHRETLCSMGNLAVAVEQQGRPQEAVRLYRETLDAQRRLLGDEDPDTLITMGDLAFGVSLIGLHDEADALYLKALEIRRRVSGPEHPETLRSINNWASRLLRRRQYGEAETLYRNLLEVQARVLGEEHPLRATSLQGLRIALVGRGEYAEAEKLSREILRIRRKVLGEDHPHTYAAINLLRGLLLLRALAEPTEVRADMAELLATQRTIALRRESVPYANSQYAWALLACEPPDMRDPETALPFAEKAAEVSGWGSAGILDTLALAYYLTGDSGKAIETQRAAIQLLAPDDVELRAIQDTRLAAFLQETGQNEEAESIIRSVVNRARDRHSKIQTQSVQRMTDLLLLLHARGRYALHEESCEALVSLQQRTVPQYGLGVAEQVVYYATALLEQERYTEAQEVLRHLLDIRKLAHGETDWRTARVMSLLGASLSGLGKFDEAEPLLLDAYNQMRDNAETIPEYFRNDYIRGALERIVNLYVAWGKPGRANEYRAMISQRVEGEITATPAP